MKTSPLKITALRHADQSDEQLLFVQFKRTVVIVLLLGCVCSFPVIEWLDLDLRLSGWFYSAWTDAWYCCDQEPFSFIDHLTVWLTTGMAVISLILFLATHIYQQNSWENRAGLIMSLVILIGPVLVVNCAMKPFFSRARPREIQQFGGELPHTAAWVPSINPLHNSSFPSGHASIGFYFLTPAFLVQHGRVRFLTYLSLGMIFGMTVGFSRIAQGGHFISDVVCSMFLMTTISAAISAVVFRYFPVHAFQRKQMIHYDKLRIQNASTLKNARCNAGF